MTNKKENTQRVLDNHGNITQNGDIIEFKNSKIDNINNILIQNLENSIIEFQYNEGVLKNEKQILTKLLSLNNHNFDFLIKGLNNFLSDEAIINYSLDLKIIYIKNNKLYKKMNDKSIREFIYKVKDIKSLNILLANIEQEKLDKLINILTDFLKDEKIKLNAMPDISDLRLALRFYRENVDFDFIDVVGYEFNTMLRINELINIIEKKYNKNLDILKKIKNLNKDTLELFFELNDSYKWTIEYLNKWNLLKSNLKELNLNSIEELFEAALQGYFKDEDIKEWIELSQYYLKSLNIPIIHKKNTSNKPIEEMCDDVIYSVSSIIDIFKDLDSKLKKSINT